MPAPTKALGAPPGELTGATRYRDSFWSKALILQVEVDLKEKPGAAPRADGEMPTTRIWRDAQRSDLITLDWMERRKRAEEMIS